MFAIRHFKIDRALHRYRRGQGVESRRSLSFFSLSFRNSKSSVSNCGDHPSFNSSLRSSHIWFSHIHNFKQCICYSNVERVNQKNLCLNNQWAGTLILGGDVNVSIAVKNKWTLRLLLKFRQRQPANNNCWLSRPLITTLSEGSIAPMEVSYAKATPYCNRRWEQFFCVKWGFTLSAYRCLSL